MTEVCSVGLLHSEIHGSKRTYRSPWLIAVNHVLRRLPMPRHSPCALYCFTICFMFLSSLRNDCFLILVVFYPIKFYLIVFTRSILICITFALFSFQVPFFCSWEQISATTLIVAQVYFQNFWWAQMDSNHRPHAYQACALTTWAMRPYLVEMRRIELLTPCVQGRCSPSWATPPNIHLSSYDIFKIKQCK